ncbi:hypothetical protein Tco_0279392 [Tanacetum coccineum]
MLRKGSNFSKESIEKSWEKESAYKGSVKFIPLDSSFVEFIQPGFASPLVLILPSNWFPLTRVKWLPLMANSFAVSGMDIKKVTEIVDVKNWSVNNFWLRRWFASLFKWNSPDSLTKSSIQG